MNQDGDDLWRSGGSVGERVRVWVREDFGVDLSLIEEVGHGADEVADLWRGVCVDGAPYAVKLSGGGTPAGLVVSAHLAEHAVAVWWRRCRAVVGGCGANARAVDCPLCRGDLMFLIGGVLAFAPVSPQERSWFFDGYGVADLDPTHLAYYRCTRALEDLVDPAAQVVDVHRHSETERAHALSIVRGVLSRPAW